MKALLACLGLFGLVASASAITIDWQIPSAWGEKSFEVGFVNVADGTSVTTDGLLAAVKGEALPSGYTAITLGNGDFGVGSDDDTAPSWTVTFDTMVESGSYYLVLFDAATQAYAYNTQGVAYNTSAAFQVTTANGLPGLGKVYDPGSYTEGVVPEPTALALLALGVAGLALRRKMA